MKLILILCGLISLILVIIGMVYIIFDEKKIARRLFIEYVRQHVIPTSTIKFYPGMFQNKEFRYRLGDMVRGKKHRIDEKHGKKYHCKNFPNSIACQYMEQTNKNNDFPVLLKILAKNKIKAPQDVIVIHLRIGDVIDDCEKCTVNDFLLGKKCVIFSEGKSYVKPLSFYQENMIHCKNTRLKKITIMIGAHQSNKKNSYKSYEYVMVIKSLFEQEGFKVDLRYQNSPDDDFAYATSAKYFFPGGGGYSQLIKNVNYRLGGIILPPRIHRSLHHVAAMHMGDEGRRVSGIDKESHHFNSGKINNTIIMIPYRNREKDLQYFLQHSYPLLKAEINNLMILIIEQSTRTKLFNRGKLLNIGFKESNGDYFLTHDVDINPYKSTIKKLYTKEVGEDHIMGIFTSKFNTLGGIIKFRPSTFKKINGFPNDFWGWGCEDKDLQNRAEFNKLKITKNIRNLKNKAKKYFKIFYGQDDKNKSKKYSMNDQFVYKKWKTITDKEKLKYIKNNGLTTLDYRIIKDDLLMEGVRKIIVDI